MYEQGLDHCIWTTVGVSMYVCIYTYMPLHDDGLLFSLVFVVAIN